MKRKDKQLLNLVKKKKRLAPPFQGKVEGGNARARPDRRSSYQRGGVARGEPADTVEYPESEDQKKDRYLGIVKRQEGGTIGSIRRRVAPGERREPPPLTGPTEGMQRGGAVAYKDGGGKWIGKARASMERRGTVGSLRKAMGAKEGQKISTASLQAKKAQAERTGNTKMMRKVNFALNVRK